MNFSPFHDMLRVMHTLLGKTELFSSLDGEKIESIIAHSDFISFGAGDVIFDAGDPGDCLYIVEDGEVSIIQTEEGKSREIALYIGGDYFGEMDLMTAAKRNAKAVASTRCSLLRFPSEKTTFTDLVAEYPGTGAWLLHSFIRVTSARIREANSLFKDNSPLVNQLREQVYGDKLTGLKNKTFLEENISSLLTDRAALLMMKPDNYKLINDTYGHAAGDDALILIAKALPSILPENAVLVRFMGNEMAFLLPGSGREAAFQFAEVLRQFMNTLDISPVTGNKPFTLSVSIGISLYPDHTNDPAELIKLSQDLPLVGRARGGNKILFPEDREE
ncbi:GGDEF domain-containing protein [Brucepastera parasyntrophica]|uniref:GGDEF domain-containing protein n=1 Tax=Brucepastera parasyntrophica TaxID=2880008 RepID=UPI0021092D75|nr:GGDEF domain-containing protein [Brucepastera parasyntrophica]ULQ59405.1 GGDEF domain-containing protein [Brucepastera parasyntrophica]